MGTSKRDQDQSEFNDDFGLSGSFVLSSQERNVY